MILRDCFLWVCRFDAFEERLGITRHVLVDRLRRLVAHGVLKKVPYQQNPVRYEYRLTQAGLDMYPLLACLRHWGDRYAAGRSGPPLLFRHWDCGHVFDPVVTCSGCGDPIDSARSRCCQGQARMHRGAALPGNQGRGRHRRRRQPL